MGYKTRQWNLLYYTLILLLPGALIAVFLWKVIRYLAKRAEGDAPIPKSRRF